MASTTATSTLDSTEAGTIKDFHWFPQLPPELRIRIWRMAYDAIPETLVYRFRLRFSFLPDLDSTDDEEGTTEPQAFLEPLEEVKYLTRELRSLRRVNTECRYEGERLFDGCLRLNQTEQGNATDIYPPINLPWKDDETFFCFVDLKEHDLVSLQLVSTVLIDQVFATVQLLGLSVDRALENGITSFNNYDSFAIFILEFPAIQNVSLVSDRLMPEEELDDLPDDDRSSYPLSCWYDWAGRVPEDVIGLHCKDGKLVTAENHLDAINEFAGSMHDYGEEFAEALCELSYGMIFRTTEDLDFLLLDDETLEKFRYDMMSQEERLMEDALEHLYSFDRSSEETESEAWGLSEGDEDV